MASARAGIDWLNPNFNVALVRKLVAAQFPAWTDLTVQPVELDGHDNRTFRLGSEMCVRLPSRQAYAAQVEKEQKWLPRLEPLLPLTIPVPLAMGVPGEGFPWHWSIYRWLEGEVAAVATIEDLSEFASTLAEFLAALQRVDPTSGPDAGPHSFYRGGALQTYDAQTRDAMAELQDHVDVNKVMTVWDAALEALWEAPPVWVHGDIAATNLLVVEGRLSSVIDFGCSAVGDPACDLTIAWNFFSGVSREAFRQGLSLDRATWARGRGWALWKALITLAQCLGTDASKASEASGVIGEVLADHEHHT